ncbi:MAG: TIGR03364 family FAD-dependent oxidoreductase [Saprospiraceae bacterium]|nr:TIGR03364 family FAD-dependent oxidoreductase [Saprospiraceae bacterium]
MNQFDVIVVGAGIVGISHAFHCCQSGLKVALIERNDYPMDATVRNFGQIVPSGMNLKWQQFGRESLDIYKEIQKEYDITVRQEGTVYLASDHEEMSLLEELSAINQENDYPSSLLTKNECLLKYPGLKESYVEGGLFFPDEINVDPRQTGKRIITYTRQKYDLEYIPNTLIKNLITANGSVMLTTASGDLLKASNVFLCSGNEFQLLYPELFKESDLQMVKLQMMQTVNQPQQRISGSILTGWTIRRYESFQECPSYTSIKAKEDTSSYQRKMGIHILFKQNQDGSVIIGDSHEYCSVKNEEKFNSDTNWEINQFMLEEAAKIFDLETFSLQKIWNGYYSQCTSSDIYARTISDQIHIITGIGGKGMTASLGYAKKNIEHILSIKA